EIERKEEARRIEAAYPKLKKVEGKYFKFKNSYSLPETPSDYWWLFIKVTEVRKEDLYIGWDEEVMGKFRGWSFCTDKYSTIEISMDDQMSSFRYLHFLDDCKEITEDEFNREWNKMVDKLDKLP